MRIERISGAILILLSGVLLLMAAYGGMLLHIALDLAQRDLRLGDLTEGVVHVLP